MPKFSMLTAYERTLAKKFKLIEYFKHNKNYLFFIVEMRRIIDKRFDGITQAEWTKSGLAYLAQEFLKHNEKLFQYANDIYATNASLISTDGL